MVKKIYFHEFFGTVDRSLIFSYFKFKNSSNLIQIDFNGLENILLENFGKFHKKWYISPYMKKTFGKFPKNGICYAT